MANIIMPRTAPECPLCLKKMKPAWDAQGRKIFVCLDPMCEISIHASDPACGKWVKDQSTMPTCVFKGCGAKMRIFFRTTDDYFKAQCPKCRKEGRITQVERGRVLSPTPASWSIDPKEVLKDEQRRK